MIRYVLQGIIMVLVVLLGAQSWRLHSEKLDHQKTKIALGQAELAASQEKLAREQVAREVQGRVMELERKHAEEQQLAEEKSNAKIRQLEKDLASERTRNERLSDTITKNTTRAATARRDGETEAAAFERVQYRLEKAGALLAEGVRLLQEGRGGIRDQALGISRLQDQLMGDRGLCEAGHLLTVSKPEGATQ